MKRRNPDTQKLRKMKKRGVGEGLGSSSLVYMKLLVAWTLLLMADFLLGFRFEYLWPFWLLLRSIYDSFRYQGMAFSVFFVCATVTSDLVCFLFIPVQWLFFLASTYVWVQYVWQAERGVCLPSVGLWLLFVYVEASVRLKELSTRTFPFTLDLCRPFAAHCIGYPVVTLGFGLKSYVGYKFRLRKQREVAKENKLYDKLLAEALPSEYQEPPPAPPQPEEDLLSLPNAQGQKSLKNGRPVPLSGATLNGAANGGPARAAEPSGGLLAGWSLSWLSWSVRDWLGGWGSGAGDDGDEEDDDDDSESPVVSSPPQAPPKPRPPKKQPKRPHSRLPRDSSAQQVSPLATLSSQTKESPGDSHLEAPSSVRSNGSASGGGSVGGGSGSSGAGSGGGAATVPTAADEGSMELERLRGDVRALRGQESELRGQLSSSASLTAQLRSEAGAARAKAEALEAKLSNVSRSRDQERSVVQTLERKLVEEQRWRRELEEREKERAKEARKGDKAKPDCSELCRQKKRELENDLRLVRRDLRLREDQLLSMDSDLKDLQLYKEKNGNSDALLSALDGLREKNQQLEKSLSAENKLKQDLFSALGEANRKLEIAQKELMRKTRELTEALARGSMGSGFGGGLGQGLGGGMGEGGGELDQNLQALAATVAAATASPLFDSSPNNSPATLPLSFTPPRSH